MKKCVAVLFAVFIILLNILSLVGCVADKNKSDIATEIDMNSQDYTIAVEVGTVTEENARKAYPNANYIYVNDTSSGYLAVKSGQADAYACSKEAFECAEKTGIAGLKEYGKTIGEPARIAVGVSPKSTLDSAVKMMNDFLTQLESDGTLADMRKRWIIDMDYTMPQIEQPVSPDKSISIGTTGLLEPYTFYDGTTLTGFDIEMMKRFALWANADLNISTYDWSGIVPACALGKDDYIISNIMETAERHESIDFSKPYCVIETILVQQDDSIEAKDAKYTNLSDFEGSCIGGLTGSVYSEIIGRHLTDFTNKYYDDVGSEILALRNGNIDVVAVDLPVATLIMAQNSDFAIFPTIVENDCYGYALEKNSVLTDDVSALIERFKADGTLEALQTKWFSGDPDKMHINMSEYDGYEAPNGTLRYIHDSTQQPMSYIDDNGDSAGYEVELLLKIAKELGREVSIEQANFSGLLTAVSMGSYDIASGCISITDERRESIDFPTSHYQGGVVFLCRKSDLPEEKACEFSDISELNGKRIGVLTGSTFDALTHEYIADAQVSYFNTYSDLARTLADNKIDSFLCDLPIAKSVCSTNDSITYMQKTLLPDKYGYIFSKDAEGEKLCTEMNEYLEKIKSDGTMKELDEIWFGSDESRKKPMDISLLEVENGTLNYATCSDMVPFAYILDNQFVGFDIDLITRFCYEYGYGLELEDVFPSSLISSVQSGKSDFGGCGLSITEERATSVLFSNPYYEGGVVAVVRTAQHPAKSDDGLKSTIASIAESFEKTFIRENRWMLVVSGLTVTLIISVSSALAGTVLGFGVCIMRRSKNKLLSRIMAIVIRLVQGIPMVVLLMVLYYIVFADSDTDGIIVAVIGFSLNFGVNVSEMMRSGIDAVNAGQWEAANALGFGQVKTFTKVILPQAVLHFLPTFKGEFINMMKMTSVVGYIAVQDLTKASDIIRSRTYEAIFPLIAITVIYFLLAWGLTSLIGLAEIGFDPHRRASPVKDLQKDTISTQKDDQVFTVNNGDSEVIRIEHLKKAYPGVVPLRDINAVIKRGDIVTIIGPSGTGKSTLLRLINRLELPTDGKIVVLGSDMGDKNSNISLIRRQVGMVFQNFNLFPHLTVIENIMLAPIELKGISKQKSYEMAMHLLETVGLSQKALNYPDELSGGQKQRVAIARALAMRPEIILFDEPTSALDPTMVSEVLAVIRNLAQLGLTMMIVTHEMKFARDVSTRIFYLDEGVVYEDGTPSQIFNNPQKEKTRQFVRRLKVFHFDITSKQFDFIGMFAAIENFCTKHALSDVASMGIKVIAEELCVQTILPQLSNEIKLGITAEYSDDADEVFISITYNGTRIDYLDRAEPICAALIKHAAKSIDYSFDDLNRYRIMLKL